MKTNVLKYFLALMLLSGIYFTLTAQPAEEADDPQFESLRIAIFTNVLNLTPDEAKTFWPVYNEYLGKQRALRKEEQLARRSIMKNYAAMTDRDAEEAIVKMMNYEEKLLALKKEYVMILTRTIPAKKVLLLHNAETSYKKALLDKIREQKGINGQ